MMIALVSFTRVTLLAAVLALSIFRCCADAASVVGCPSPVHLTVCAIPTVDEFPFTVATAARFTLRYYTEPRLPGYATGTAMRFNVPNVSWEFRFLGDGKHTSRNVVRAWALEGTAGRCDALIGQGYSSLAQAVSPLLDDHTAWVAPLATSDTLSNKALHPDFNRVLPTDRAAVALTAAVFRRFQWASVNLFCYDDDYGRSLSGGLREVMAAMGGRIERSQCTANIAGIDATAVRQILDVFVAESPSRVVFMAMFPGPSFDTIVNVIISDGYDKKLIFVFSEAACTTTTEGYLRIPSALCVTYLANKTRQRPFDEAYAARDLAPVQAALAAVGANTTHSLTVTSLVTALIHDATLHAMRALIAFHTSNCTMPMANSSSSSLVPGEGKQFASATAAVRGVHTSGFTGPIDLDAKGDRPVTNAVLYNAVDGKSEAVAHIFGDRVVFLQRDGQPTVDNTLPPLVLLNQTFVGNVPSATFPIIPEGTTTKSPNMMIVSVAAGAGGLFLITLVAVVVLVFALRRGSSKDNSNAPKDSTKPFAIVFTDIQASTALWARVPEQMSEAVDVHHATIRRLIAHHSGYEVKTIGDSFMAAFHGAKAALEFSMAVQLSLYGSEWGTSVFDDHYRQLMADANLDASLTRDDVLYAGAWNGLRVRIGAHYGHGKIQHDVVTKGFDYYGTVVNTAARVEAIGHGGQTLVTRAVLDSVSGNHVHSGSEKYGAGGDDHGGDIDVSSLNRVGSIVGAVATDLGQQSLRGLDDPVRVCQLLPSPVADRRFPSLRLDIQVDDVDVDNAGAQSSSANEFDEFSSADPKGSPNQTQRASAPESTELSTTQQAHATNGDESLLELATRIAQRRVRRITKTTGASASVSKNPSRRPSLSASGAAFGHPASADELVVACLESSLKSAKLLRTVSHMSERSNPDSSVGASPVQHETGHTSHLSETLPISSFPSSPQIAVCPVGRSFSGAIARFDARESDAPTLPGQCPLISGNHSGSNPHLIQIQNATPGTTTTAHASSVHRVALEKDRDNLVLLASFLRKLLSVVPSKERQRCMTRFAKRWHANVSAVRDTRQEAGHAGGAAAESLVEKNGRAPAADDRTLMAVVERVWLTLERPK